MANGWTHRVCESCYIEELKERGEPLKSPVLIKPEFLEHWTCCQCDEPTVFGIYMRLDPKTLSCTHEKGKC
jgi:hypothetical protein